MKEKGILSSFYTKFVRLNNKIMNEKVFLVVYIHFFYTK